jgi:hypothetical protein
MPYIKLADSTQIPIEEGASLDHIEHIAKDETAALAVGAAFTPANLTHVEFATAPEDEPHGIYENLALIEPPTRQDTDDGKVLVTIRLREKTDLELRVDALEESQATQDGAIEDLGLAVSDIVEG